MNSSKPPEHIAVLGGGISGLTAAFHLGRRFPDTRITLLEASSRLGGWIQTESVDLGPEYGQVVLEAGPRTLRPVSKPLLELVRFGIFCLSERLTRDRLIYWDSSLNWS